MSANVWHDNIKYGSTSTIVKEGRVVKKTLTAWTERGPFLRELKALEILKEFDWCPKVLNVDHENVSFTMTYVGEPFQPWLQSQYPDDFLEQMESIIKDMQSKNISHNDINKRNLMIENDKMYLIDFGWCSTLDHDFSLGDPEIPNEFVESYTCPTNDWVSVMKIWDEKEFHSP